MNEDYSRLRLLSWNICFDDYCLIERTMMILSHIEPLLPHVVAFQEITSLSELLFDEADSPLSRHYQKVLSDLPYGQWYWEGIYSRLPVGCKSCRYPYSHSEMGRGVTLLHVQKLDLVVACTHLESENEHPLRRQQFVEAIEQIHTFECRNNIIMGDTNIRDHQLIDDLLPPGWCDVWLELNPHQPGYTVDAIRNPLCSGNRLDRLDRVYCNCKDYEPKKIYIIGDQQQQESNSAIMPSDHFGLVVDFKY